MDEQNVRKDSVSREVLRHPEFADSVELSRVRDYFLCMSFSFFVLSSFFLLVVVDTQVPFSLRRIGRAVPSGKDTTRSNQGHEREVGCYH